MEGALTLEGPCFSAFISRHGEPVLRRGALSTLQFNMGKHCNQACTHCHVGAGPHRTEAASRAVAQRVLELLEANEQLRVLDLTGGAPELNPNFKWLVTKARELGRDVIDRCNLTVLLEPGMEEMATFLAAKEVRIVASLPCYSAQNVDSQRGPGVFSKSIQALRRLNDLGYGDPGELTLDLVYNPAGAFLPPAQATLEHDYRSELRELGLRFNSLLVLANLPVQRFSEALDRRDELTGYLELLVDSFNPDTLGGLMCRDTLSVSWDGKIYGCDFNQMLDLGLGATVFELEDLAQLEGSVVPTGVHCFGCTAGAGSSCGGALT